MAKNERVSGWISPPKGGDITLPITGDGVHFADCLWQMAWPIHPGKKLMEWNVAWRHVSFHALQCLSPKLIASSPLKNGWWEDEIAFLGKKAYFQVLFAVSFRVYGEHLWVSNLFAHIVHQPHIAWIESLVILIPRFVLPQNAKQNKTVV